MSRCFSAARGPIRSIADSTHSRRSKGWRSMSMRPASILEKSRMSLMIVSSESPRVADGGGEVALVLGQRRVQQQPAHADDRVHRRADLVAHRRQEGALGFVGGFGLGTRLLRLLEHLRVLDRDHRLVGEGLDQRDFLVGEGLASACARPRRRRCPGPPRSAARTAARCCRSSSVASRTAAGTSGPCSTSGSSARRACAAQ